MKYIFVLAIVLSLTLIWQTASLEERNSHLKSVEHEQIVTIPPQAS